MGEAGCPLALALPALPEQHWSSGHTLRGRGVGGLILAAVPEPFDPSGTDQQEGPLDLRWSGWACLGSGRCL